MADLIGILGGFAVIAVIAMLYEVIRTLKQILAVLERRDGNDASARDTEIDRPS